MKVLLFLILLLSFSNFVKTSCFTYACTSNTYANNVCGSYTASLGMYTVTNSACIIKF